MGQLIVKFKKASSDLTSINQELKKQGSTPCSKLDHTPSTVDEKLSLESDDATEAEIRICSGS